MKSIKVALLTTISLCNAFPSCYMHLSQTDHPDALLTIEYPIKSPKQHQITYVCSCPVCQKNAKPENKEPLDHETQVVLANFANIVGNFINIVQDPNNKEQVGKQVTSMIGSVVNIAQQVIKRSGNTDQLFTVSLEHFTHTKLLDICFDSIDPAINLINSLIQLAIEFIVDNPEISLLEAQLELEKHATNLLKSMVKNG